MSDFPDFEWPEDPDVQEVLKDLLVEEANCDTFPGAPAIAERLATGTQVLATRESAGIWHGGLGNHLKMCPTVDGGVGIIALKCDISIWKAASLAQALRAKAQLAKVAADAALHRLQKINKAMDIVGDVDPQIETLTEQRGW